MRAPKLSYANVVSSLALFVALGGTSWALARNSVGSPQLKRDAVTSVKVKDRSITSADLADSAAGRRGPRGAQGPAGETGPAGVAPTAEAWKPIPYENGWTAYANAHETPAYRKDQLGIVHLRGLATHPAGTPTPGPITTLPPGYRPHSHELFGVNDGGSANIRIDVFADGVVLWNGGSASPTVTLSGISFATD